MNNNIHKSVIFRILVIFRIIANSGIFQKLVKSTKLIV